MSDAHLQSSGEFLPLTVGAVQHLTEDAVEIELVPREQDEQLFAARLAGQHLALRIPVLGDERRTYSITTPPGQPLRVGIRCVPGGKVSTHLVTVAKRGDVVESLPPSGRFTADPTVDVGQAWLLIAAGSGITPVLAIARSVLEQDSAAQVTLLFANRSVSTIMFRDGVDALKAQHLDRLTIHHFLTRERRDLDLFDGRLDGDRLRQVYARLLGGTRFDHAFICGPEAMAQELRGTLKDLGMDGSSIHTELFEVAGAARIDPARLELLRSEAGSAAGGDLAAGASVQIRLNGLEQSLRVPPGATVLEAALASGLPVPYACAGGVCATCRAHVDSGEVTMRVNQALDDDEVAQGFVLTCQSMITSDSARIDFDRR